MTLDDGTVVRLGCSDVAERWNRKLCEKDSAEWNSCAGRDGWTSTENEALCCTAALTTSVDAYVRMCKDNTFN